MRLLLTIAVASCLSGCGAIQSYQNNKRVAEAQADFDLNQADCHKRFPLKPMAPRFRCLAEAKHGYAQRIGANPDLVQQMNARMIALAEKSDAGKVSQSEFDIEAANISVAYETQVRQRGNEAAVANAAVMSAYAANAPRTCMRNGNTVNCF